MSNESFLPPVTEENRAASHHKLVEMSSGYSIFQQEGGFVVTADIVADPLGERRFPEGVSGAVWQALRSSDRPRVSLGISGWDGETGDTFERFMVMQYDQEFSAELLQRAQDAYNAQFPRPKVPFMPKSLEPIRCTIVDSIVTESGERRVLQIANDYEIPFNDHDTVQAFLNRMLITSIGKNEYMGLGFLESQTDRRIGYVTVSDMVLSVQLPEEDASQAYKDLGFSPAINYYPANELLDTFAMFLEREAEMASDDETPRRHRPDAFGMLALTRFIKRKINERRTTSDISEEIAPEND